MKNRFTEVKDHLGGNHRTSCEMATLQVVRIEKNQIRISLVVPSGFAALLDVEFARKRNQE